MNSMFSSNLDEAQINQLSAEIARYCRLCLLHRGTVDILSEDMMAKLFKLNIELVSKYKLPQKICKFCESTINTFFEQRETYEKNQWTLFKMMKTLDKTKESLKKCKTQSTTSESSAEYEGNIVACNEVYKAIMNSFGKKKCTVFECEPNYKDNVYPGIEVREMESSNDLNRKSMKSVGDSLIRRNNIDEFNEVHTNRNDIKDELDFGVENQVNNVYNEDNVNFGEEVQPTMSRNDGGRNFDNLNGIGMENNGVPGTADNAPFKMKSNNIGELNEIVDTTYSNGNEDKVDNEVKSNNTNRNGNKHTVDNEVNCNTAKKYNNEEKADSEVNNEVNNYNSSNRNNKDKENTNTFKEFLELGDTSDKSFENDIVGSNVKIESNKRIYGRTYGSAKKDTREKCQGINNTNILGIDSQNVNRDDCGNKTNRHKVLSSDDTSGSFTESFDIVSDLFSVDVEDKLSLIPHITNNKQFVVFLKRPHLNSFLTKYECSFDGFETKDLERTKWKLKNLETIHEAKDSVYNRSSFVNNGRLLSYNGQESQGWLINKSSLKLYSEENKEQGKDPVESAENHVMECQTEFKFNKEMVKKCYGKQTNDEFKKSKGNNSKSKTSGETNTKKSNKQTKNSREGTSRNENTDANYQNKNEPGNEIDSKGNTKCQEEQEVGKKGLQVTDMRVSNQKPIKNLVEYLQAQKQSMSNGGNKSSENKRKSLPKIKISKEGTFVDEENSVRNTTAGETYNKNHEGKTEEKVGTSQNEKQNKIDQNENLTGNQIESVGPRPKKVLRKYSNSTKNPNKRPSQNIVFEDESLQSVHAQFGKRKKIETDVEICKTEKPTSLLINDTINDVLMHINGENNHIKQNDTTSPGEIQQDNKSNDLFKLNSELVEQEDNSKLNNCQETLEGSPEQITTNHTSQELISNLLTPLPTVSKSRKRTNSTNQLISNVLSPLPTVSKSPRKRSTRSTNSTNELLSNVLTPFSTATKSARRRTTSLSTVNQSPSKRSSSNFTLEHKDTNLETNSNDLKSSPLSVTPKSTELTTAGLISNILDPSLFFIQSPRKSPRRNSHNLTNNNITAINEKLQTLGQQDGCKIDTNDDKINANILSLPLLTDTPEKDNASMSPLPTLMSEKGKNTSLRINSAKKNNVTSQPTDSTPEKSPICSNGGSTNSSNLTPDSLSPNNVTPNVTSNSSSSLSSVKKSTKRLGTPRGPGKSSVNKLSAKALANSNGLQLQMTVEKLTNKILCSDQKFDSPVKNQNQIECLSNKNAAKH